jgi:hypothetical protein
MEGWRMEMLTGKVLLLGCCVWAFYVIFRIGANLLGKRKADHSSI